MSNTTNTMRYLRTLDLWDASTNHAVRTGQIRLQRGQWVRCGTAKPSRFVRVNPTGIIWAIHPHGEKGVSQARFADICSKVRLILTQPTAVIRLRGIDLSNPNPLGPT